MAINTSKKPRRGAKPRKPAPKRATTSKLVGASKLDQIVAALRTPKGATITDLMELTGWQIHSVRGALAGAIKKGRGLLVKSEKAGDKRVYRIGGKP